AAKTEGINLKIVSATRPFSSQKGIWEAKWTGARRVEGQNLATEVPDPKERALKILRFSSMPGTSRHHWGTDIDLNNLNNSWFESGTGKKIYEWLAAHAYEYGFCQPYSPKGEQRPHGYEEEKWHWSYMPLAKKYLAAYLNQVDYTHIHGFKGSEAAEQIDVIQHYVGGIAPTCRNW
ncbi:MAG: M15 family metallopeptidase, partial [Bacteroidota bacterium]